MDAKQKKGGGWTEEKTVTAGQAAWVTPEEGLKVRGTLTRAFFFTSQNGTSAAYELTAIAGETITRSLVSEKAAFKELIRRCGEHDEIEIEFVKKEGLIERSDGREMWTVNFRRRAAKKRGRSVLTMLAESVEMAKLDSAAKQAGAWNGEDAPF